MLSRLVCSHCRHRLTVLACLLRWRQVIRSRDRLLDQLYNYLMGLKPFEIDALLAEDPTLVKRWVGRVGWVRRPGAGMLCRSWWDQLLLLKTAGRCTAADGVMPWL